MRILCVDDNQDTCELLTAILDMSNLEAVSVPSVGEALQRMKGEQFSLYVLDGQMPGVSGLTLCEQIREIDEETPIVIFSGSGYQLNIDAGILAGANAYVVKPDSAELVSTIKRLLGEVRGPALPPPNREAGICSGGQTYLPLGKMFPLGKAGRTT